MDLIFNAHTLPRQLRVLQQLCACCCSYILNALFKTIFNYISQFLDILWILFDVLSSPAAPLSQRCNMHGHAGPFIITYSRVMIFARLESICEHLKAPPFNAAPRLVGRRTSSWYLTLFTVQRCEEGKSSAVTAKGSG